MQSRYATYHSALRLALRSIDGWLAWRGDTKRQVGAAPRSPGRILVCNQGHLGDAVLATSVIPLLRETWPQAQIGFLVHPGSRQVVERHPSINWVHSVDHWHTNRADVSMRQRFGRHHSSTIEALRDIRHVGYELAIDLHPFFPNSIPLLRRSSINFLVGWDGAGFGQWLDRAGANQGAPVNVLDRHAALLGLVGIDCDGSSLRPSLPLDDADVRSWRERAEQFGIADHFVAMHIGAHAAHRRWPQSHWAEVANELIARRQRVVLFGHGAEEVLLGGEIATRCPAAIDLCGRLQWGELLAAIARCDLLLSHDSVAAHLASAFDRPRICIATGIHDLRMWLRANERSVVLSDPVACAPCGRIAGCSTMQCIRGVSGDTVVEAATALIGAAGDVTLSAQQTVLSP